MASRVGDINRPKSHHTQHRCAGGRCYAAPIRQHPAAGSLEELSVAGSSRTPFCLACRTRTIRRCWSVPSLSGLLSTLPPVPGVQAALSFNMPAATSTRRCPFTTARSENASWRSISATHRRFGPSASKSRSTKSAGRFASSAGIVMRLVSPLTTPTNPFEAHQTLHRAASHLGAFTMQLTPHLPGAELLPEIRLPHPTNPDTKFAIPPAAGRTTLRFPHPPFVLIISRRGDRHLRAEQARPRKCPCSHPRTRSSAWSAVEHLCQGEIRRSLPQNLIRPPQLTTLPPQLHEFASLVGRQPGPDTLIPLSPPNPLTQRLRRTPEHLRDRTDRRPPNTDTPPDAPKPSEQPAPEPPTNTLSVFPYSIISQPIESPENPG